LDFLRLAGDGILTSGFGGRGSGLGARGSGLGARSSVRGARKSELRIAGPHRGLRTQAVEPRAPRLVERERPRSEAAGLAVAVSDRGCSLSTTRRPRRRGDGLRALKPFLCDRLCVLRIVVSSCRRDVAVGPYGGGGRAAPSRGLRVRGSGLRVSRLSRRAARTRLAQTQRRRPDHVGLPRLVEGRGILCGPTTHTDFGPRTADRRPTDAMTKGRQPRKQLPAPRF
jgi:hypothetical protein